VDKTYADYINETIAQGEAIRKQHEGDYWKQEPQHVKDAGLDWDIYSGQATFQAHAENQRIKDCESDKRANARVACEKRNQLPDGSVRPDLSPAECMAMWADGIPGGKDIAETFGQDEHGGDKAVVGPPGLQVEVTMPKRVAGERNVREEERAAAEGYHKQCFKQEHRAN
jgi:hypothetical protein